jgi:hypothetical protein
LLAALLAGLVVIAIYVRYALDDEPLGNVTPSLCPVLAPAVFWVRLQACE